MAEYEAQAYANLEKFKQQQSDELQVIADGYRNELLQ